jgi:hypothetical protein
VSTESDYANSHQYYYLAPFRGVSRDGRTLLWSGIHPENPGATFSVRVQQDFVPVRNGLTHEIFVGARRHTGYEQLHRSQCDFRIPAMPTSAVALRIANALCLYFLRQSKAAPIFLDPTAASPWENVIQQTYKGLLTAQLRAMRISLQAYAIDPELYKTLPIEGFEP